MSFRPFGTSFRLHSPYGWPDCRDRIRKCLVPANQRIRAERPRGIFFGRFLLLWMRWFDLFDRQSRPKLICWFVPEAQGTRLVGLTLPGISMLIFMPLVSIPLLIFAFVVVFADPGYEPVNPAAYLIVRLLFGATLVAIVCGLLVLMHRQVRQARPMLTFLVRTLDVSEELPG